MLCEGVEGTCLELRFEQGRCRRIGPETIPAGEVTLVFSNYTDSESGIDLEILDEGMTWRDMRGLFLDGQNASQPEWSVDVANSGLMWPGQYSESQKELTAGIHVVLCWTNPQHRIWLAEQLVVEE
jgi:hypothetical protein